MIDITDPEEKHEVFDIGERPQEDPNRKKSKDAGRPYIPRGEQPGVLIGVEKTETGKDSKSPGTPMLVWTFAVSQGYAEGRELKVWTPMTEQLQWKLWQIVDGLQLESEGDGKYCFTDPKHQGSKCALMIIDDPRNRKFAKLERILPV
jgi:hypothetical protein